MRAFFDTNVLIYAVTADPRKRQADRILRAGGTVSVQVLNEFANVAHKKLHHDWAGIAFALDQFRLSFEAIWPLTLDTHAAALPIARDNRLPFYDALIVGRHRGRLRHALQRRHAGRPQDRRTHDPQSLHRTRRVRDLRRRPVVPAARRA